MEFIYKLRHKKSGKYLSCKDLGVSDKGDIYYVMPLNIDLNIIVNGIQTSSIDWEIVKFAIIPHETVELL